MEDKGDITNIKFAFPCQRQWDELQLTDNPDVRFCHECSQHVRFIRDRQDWEKYSADTKCFAAKTYPPHKPNGIVIAGGVEERQPIYDSRQTFIFSLGYRYNLTPSQLDTIKSLRYLGAFVNLSMKKQRVGFNVTLPYPEELDRIVSILEKEDIIYSLE